MTHESETVAKLCDALERLLIKERRRYSDDEVAEKFYRKEFATELAILAKARGRRVQA
jgi:hypothetical protein